MTEPTNGTPDRAPDDATREIPHDATSAAPSSYTYPAPASASPSAAASVSESPGESAGESPGEVGTPLTDEPAPRERKRTGLVIGAVAALAVLGTGGVLAYNALSGGGSQPAEVLPADAYAYMRIDIDPSAGQKIAAVRFLNKIPELKDLGTGDARKSLWELATKDADNECVAKFDYDKDIAPWIGERAGAALRPGGTSEDPNFALALQVTDEAKAQDTLTKLFACDDSEEQPDLRMKGGYALVTLPGKGDDLVAAIDKGTLASNATFTDDMAALGGDGVVSFWGDLQPMLKDATNMAPDAAADAGFSADDVEGRFAAAVRFDPSYVELAGIARGVKAPGTAMPGPGGDSTALTTLPEGTMIAAHMANAGQGLETAWPELEKQLDELAAAEGQDDMLALIEDQFGISLPDDLAAIFGSSFTFAMPEQDLEDTPVLGFKVVSTEAARAEEVLTNVEDLAGSSFLTKEVDGDRLYVATTPDYLTQLKADGTLGDSEAFKLALDDVTKSQVAYYVDLDKLEKLYLEEADDDTRPALEALRAVGLSLSVTAAGEGSFSLRVVGN